MMTAQATETTVHNTFVIERNYPRRPENVFAAFAQPERKRRWYAEGNHDIQEFAMDFRVGGSEKFCYRFREGHPIAGSEIANEGIYQDIVPNKRIVLTTKMSLDGKTTVVTLATLEFVAAGDGTDLILTHQGVFIEWADGPAMIEAGWRSLLERVEKNLAEHSGS
jgi:uncharacterized protein YndB with AHSA1/START domain